MKVLHSWLQEYISEPLPSSRDIAEKLTMHAFEVEGVEEIPGGDGIINADILPNRAHDCLSHQGIAREVATLFDLTFKLSEISYQKDETFSSGDLVQLDVPVGMLVPRATKRVIKDVKIGPSPDWMVARLKALGQRSINNVVDITNYVMLETGQPIHAFDYDKIKTVDGKKKITIRKAGDGEKITTLDGQEFTLGSEMLVIADDESALDIAGVKGGAHSGIDEHTMTIILSACNFDPVSIRKTSRGLGLITDASKRFEQGITPELVTRAVERASQLFAELAGGTVSHDIVDVYPRKRNPYTVGVSVSEVNTVLGTSLSQEEVMQILGRLGFATGIVQPEKKILSMVQELVGVPYTYGASVSYDAPNSFDCSSFIAYVFAQSGIAVPRMATDQFVFGTPVEEKDKQPGDIIFVDRGGDGTTEHIESLGVDQHRATKVSHEFLPGTELPFSVDHNGIYLGDGMVAHASGKWYKGEVVIEKLSESISFKNIVGIRRMIADTGERFVVTVPSARLDIRIPEDLIEEIGRVYGHNNIAGAQLPEQKPEINKAFYYTQKIRDILVDEGFSEVMTYTLAETGDVELLNPSADDKRYLREILIDGVLSAGVLNAKQAALLGLEKIKLFEIGTVFSKHGEYIELGIQSVGDNEPERVAKIIGDALGKKLKGKSQGVGYFVNLTEYIKQLPEPESYGDLVMIDTKGKIFKPFSQYPFVLRDIAVWTTGGSREVEEIVKKHAGELLARADLFDEFTKDGRTSYAYHLVFQSNEKTLTDDEVNAIMQKITDDLNAHEQWQVR